MAQSITAMINSITTMSEDDKDSEVLWMTQVIDMTKKLKDNPSTDCSIIVGETRIPVHKAVVQLNSCSMLTSGSNGHSAVTEIEVEPEFDGQPDLVKKIITSFYSGTVEINDGSIKEVYKFSTIYEVGWLKIHSGHLIVNYLTQSVHECYNRFTEIFCFAHLIWDTDLFESCIRVIDEDILESLMKDDDMLRKISYRCMEILTMSSNVGFPEKDLFNLLVAWVTCSKSQKCNFQMLFENIRYESLTKDFIIESVMTYVSQNEEIFTISFLKNILSGLTDSSKDMCRSGHMSEIMKENALKRVQNLLDAIQSSDKNEEEKVNEVNSFLVRKDIRYLPDEKKEELSHTIASKGDIMISSLDWLSVVNLINNHQSKMSTVDILVEYLHKLKHLISLSEVWKLEWTRVTDKAILCAIENKKNYNLIAVEMAMSWCLANRGTTDDATVQGVLSAICYKTYGDVYNANILLPTIKHLLPNTTELKCGHAGQCFVPQTWKIKTVNEKLYKLEPFKDDVATLARAKNGVLELTFMGYWMIIFKMDKPYEPFYPMHCKKVDNETLRRFIATLKDSDEIIFISLPY